MAANAVLAMQAQAQPEAQQGNLEEIVVTARFREENVQQTPLAITALSADSLDAKSFSTIADVAAAVPNAFFREAPTAFGPSTQAYIRGVGQDDFKLSFEPGVAMYIDDVYHSDLLGSQFDLMDLERVEVLRGPQGTLFGKNAIGGAVRMVSRKPQGDNSGSVQVTMGRFDRLDLRGGFDFTLIEDKLFMRVAGVSKSRDGFQEQIDFTCDMIRRGTPQLAGIDDGLGADGTAGGGLDGAPDVVTVGSTADNTFAFPQRTQGGAKQDDKCVIDKFGADDVQGGRVALRFLANEDVEFNLSADLTEDKSSVQAQSTYAIGRLFPNAETFSLNTAGSTANLPPSLTAANNRIFNRYGIRYDARFTNPDPYQTYATYDDPIGNRVWAPEATVENWGVSGILDWDVNAGIHLKWVNAYREYDASFVTDNDGSPLLLNTVWTTQTHEQYTSELQLTGNLMNDALEWTVGGFYFDSDSFNGGRVISVHTVLDFDVLDDVAASNKSVFAHFVYHLNEQLSLTAGWRYSDDEKSYSFLHTPLAGFDPVVPLLAPNAQQTRDDWKVGADYQLNDDLMVYGQIATGFRSPGFNPRPFTTRQLLPIEGESLTAYELGLKSDWLDNRLRVNTAVFYSDYDSRVITRSTSECPEPYEMTLVPCPVTTSPWNNFLVGPAKIKGFEVEVTASLTDNFSVDGSFGYNKFTSADLTINGRERKLTGIPELQGNLGAQYVSNLDDNGSITTRLDMFHTDDIYYDPLNQPLAAEPAYTTFNGRITYTTQNQDWSVVLAVTNLTDEFYFTSKSDAITGNLSTLAGQPNRPREWSLTLRRDF
jgi:iron complex outermembrane recepter protein